MKGIPHIDYSDNFYEGCVLGKHPKKSFSKETSYCIKKIFELVHTNIHGPLTSNSLDKHRYFITLNLFFKREIRSIFYF
jgi:hypothetical protein